IPAVRAFAHKHGLSQAAVSELVALDAQMQVQNYNAEVTRLAEENRKLGDKAEDRVKAVDDWVRAMKDRGGISANELAAVYSVASSAAGIELFEKLIARLNGSVPGHQHDNRPQPAPGSIPGYENMTFAQKRAAQWSQQARGNG